MHDLEQVFRDGLAELGGEADTAPPVVRRVVEQARSGAGRRRRSALAIGAAAAAVVLVAGLGAVLLGQRSGVEGPAGPSPTPPAVAPSAPGGYRLEFWHGVAVYVPATWGWGSAPTDPGTGATALCGAGQVVQADGSRREQRTLPYVGRPIALSNACDGSWAHERPQAPYVWLGGDVPVGTVDLGGGWVRKTIAVGDVRVSVASADDALRQAILSSAHEVTGACSPRLGNPPVAGGTKVADFVPVSMTVCAYGPTGTGLDYDLLYEQELSMGPAKYLVAAVDSARPLGSSSCYGASGGEWALLRLRGNPGGFRDYVVDMSCPSITDQNGAQHVLDSETARPWAVGGINAVLHVNQLVDVPDRFIPPLP
ncbi:hypothetical protein [Nocardioides sp. CER19]|uniref:hypothetical protein n=1 Tax=Nocardioides sp. CER19 TaxID=3038538 RepID=UPI00244D5D72|nr:hypothetical protein [Nocardioides sp. CER19]MDH2415404.1 hypothetical protein [Nocardioides sp. CER19]